MGEMADFNLEFQEMSCYIAEEHRYSDPQTRYELGLIDEYGVEQYNGPGVPSPTRSTSAKQFEPDPLFHFSQIPIKLVRETEKALLCRVPHKGKEVEEWFPKKLCKRVEQDSMYVWTKFLNMKVREMVEEI